VKPFAFKAHRNNLNRLIAMSDDIVMGRSHRPGRRVKRPIEISIEASNCSLPIATQIQIFAMYR
jgi:hypothetical protein